MGVWAEFLQRQEDMRSAGMHAKESDGRKPLRFIPQALESEPAAAEIDERKRRIKQCTDAGVRKGLESAALWGTGALVATLAAARYSPSFARNFNYTARALIPSASMVAAYFIVSEKTILECTRRTSKEVNDAQRRLREQR